MAFSSLRSVTLVQDALQWLRDRRAERLVIDSRQVQAGDAFVAWPGAAVDGRQFVPQALERGAQACLVDASGIEAWAFSDDRIATMPDLKQQLGHLAAAFEGFPSAQMETVAFTGTNGKTSSTWWLAQASAVLGARALQVGTLGIGEPPLDGTPGTWIPTGLTTPDPVTLHRSLGQLLRQGVRRCAIEASSIGLAEHRLEGLNITVGVFGNLTQDHLDYHGSMEAYWAAKKRLFEMPSLRAAVVNVDDPRGWELAQGLRVRGWREDAEATTSAGPFSSPQLWTCSRGRKGAGAQARLEARQIHHTAEGLAFELVERGQVPCTVQTGFIGDYNVENLLGVAAALRALGHGLPEVAQALHRLTAVPGRMQRAGGQDAPLVVVDYAHTPDALEKALEALRPVVAARGGSLWCVFGCGGDRDRSKRPQMGAVAHAGADAVVVTSDNPRREAPEQIAQDILSGMPAQAAVHVQLDRAEAVRWAVSEAAAADVILLAGKGHEPYQEIQGVRHPMQDLQLARRALDARRLPRLMRLADVAAMVQSAVLHGDGSRAIARVHTDTRTLQPGDLFVALRGDRFDGHDYLQQAVEAGAIGVVAETDLSAIGVPGIQVPDTLAALQQCATAWRARHAIPVIAVTGSNGKTTVTQMTAAILRAWQGDLAAATRGNLNNHIGLPLTLLTLRGPGEAPERAHRVAVFELGMNHPGEIAQLAAMAQPTVAVVNNAQREHQEHLQSVQAVAEENGAVLQALPADGIAIFPAEDAYAATWVAQAAGRTLWRFAVDIVELPTDAVAQRQEPRWEHRAEVEAQAWRERGQWQVSLNTPVGSVTVQLALEGRHNVHNAVAAASAALAAGAPLEAVRQGLAAFRPVQGRSMGIDLQWQGHPVRLIDDSYNANPDSVRAAIDLLSTLPAPQTLILGDMGEVGNEGPAFHAEVGRYARERGIQTVWTVGEACLHTAEAAGSEAKHFGSVPALVADLQALPACGSILVKGSRFMRMERVVQALQSQGEPR